MHLQEMNDDASNCMEALRAAALNGGMPAELLLSYSVVDCAAKSLASMRELFQNWRDLRTLGDVVLSFRAYCEADEEALRDGVEQHFGQVTVGRSDAILRHAGLEKHILDVAVCGAALFFAVMHGAHAALQQQEGIRLDQAIEISEHIIKQLTLHDETDPDRPSHRKFLEDYGRDRQDELEKTLSKFINMADALSLNGVPYSGPSRNTVANLLAGCKDIVESNAARLKGWGGLHERVDIHMILFVETARRLENMSHTAGTREALNRGCILTAGAKLIRSLHRILQDFKKTLAENQRRSASAASSDPKQNPTPSVTTPDSDSLAPAPTTSTLDSNLESMITDDLFIDWDQWPQFDSMDFSDLFGSDFNWDQI